MMLMPEESILTDSLEEPLCFSLYALGRHDESLLFEFGKKKVPTYLEKNICIWHAGTDECFY